MLRSPPESLGGNEKESDLSWEGSSSEEEGPKCGLTCPQGHVHDLLRPHLCTPSHLGGPRRADGFTAPGGGDVEKLKLVSRGAVRTLSPSLCSASFPSLLRRARTGC